MKKVDYKSRLFHALAVSSIVLGSVGAVAMTTTVGPNIIHTQAIAGDSTPMANDTSDRSITIHKYDGGQTGAGTATGTTDDASKVNAYDPETNKDGRHPLANISFIVQKVKKADSATKIDAADPNSYVNDGASKTITTDKTGTAKADLGTGTGADGYYLVTEQKSDSVTAAIDPFIVRVPLTQTGTAGTNNSLIYDVNVYPKNDTKEVTLGPVKTFDGGGQDTSVAVGAVVNWDLTIHTPSGLYTAPSDETPTPAVPAVYAKSLVFSDPIDTSSLTFKDVNSVTAITGPATDPANQTKTVLDKDTDYTVKVPTDADNITKNGVEYKVVQISLTDAGKKKVSGSTTLTAQIATTIKAVNSDATIVNTFDSYFVPGTGVNYHETTVTSNNVTQGDPTKPGDPDVPTNPNDGDGNPTIKFGNVNVEKTDDSATPRPLANATFHLAASLQDAKDGKWITDGANKEVKVTTDSQGKAEFTGLAVDPDTGKKTYYLVETDAPAGYDVDGQIHEVEATQDTTTDATVKDSDNMLPNLPMTGSDARLLLLVTATVLIVGSGSALYIKRRRNQHQA
jgi:LPXTG-motif cell wall-anchored protein